MKITRKGFLAGLLAMLPTTWMAKAAPKAGRDDEFMFIRNTVGTDWEDTGPCKGFGFKSVKHIFNGAPFDEVERYAIRLKDNGRIVRGDIVDALREMADRMEAGNPCARGHETLEGREINAEWYGRYTQFDEKQFSNFKRGS